MSRHVTAVIRCDRELGPECWNRDRARALPTGVTIGRAEKAARALGWVVGRDSTDTCPECWSRRVRYRAGRPVVR